MSKIKLVVVDDHTIIRDGLIAIFKTVPEIEIIGDVESGDALMELLLEKEADVILLDMHMPVKNGIEVTRDIKSMYPAMKILINTMSELTEEIEGAVAAGVNGYVLKTSGSDELVRAIKMVAHGSTYFGAQVVNSFIKNAGQKMATNTFTPTELKIVTMLYEEKKQQEISEELGITSSTLTAHFQNMYRKFRVKTEMGLVKYALKERLIK